MLFKKILRAAKLESAFYRDLETDPNGPYQAVAVVVLVTIATLVAMWVVSQLNDGVSAARALGVAPILFPGMWLILATSAYVLGNFVGGFGSKVNSRHLATAIAFSASPAFLNLFLAIPGVDLLVGVIVPIWMLVAAATAVKVVTNTSFVRGLIATLPGLMVLLIIGANQGSAGGS